MTSVPRNINMRTVYQRICAQIDVIVRVL